MQEIHCLEIAVVENSVIRMYRTGLLHSVDLHYSLRASNTRLEQLSISLGNRCHVVDVMTWQVMQSSSSDARIHLSCNGEVLVSILIYSKEVHFTCIRMLLIFTSGSSSLLFLLEVVFWFKILQIIFGCFTPENQFTRIWPAGTPYAAFFNMHLIHYFQSVANVNQLNLQPLSRDYTGIFK